MINGPCSKKYGGYDVIIIAMEGHQRRKQESIFLFLVKNKSKLPVALSDSLESVVYMRDRNSCDAQIINKHHMD